MLSIDIPEGLFAIIPAWKCQRRKLHIHSEGWKLFSVAVCQQFLSLWCQLKLFDIFS